MNWFFSETLFIFVFLFSNILIIPVISVKYYVTRDDIRSKPIIQEHSTISGIKTGANKDRLQTANSNLFYIEDGGDTSHEMNSYDSYGHHLSHDNSYYLPAEKKTSKVFSEEISFVVAVVTLAVFLCFLSSVFIPVAFMFFNGGLLPYMGLNNILPITNPMAGMNGMGSMGTMMLGRRKRSLIINDQNNNLLDNYLKHFYSALDKFNYDH